MLHNLLLSFKGRFVHVLIIIFGISIIVSCEKELTEPPPDSLTGNLDSIIAPVDLSVHFIYDAQNRVVEDIFKRKDTVLERNVYEYAGISDLPFKRTYYERMPAPVWTSLIQYDAQGKKIYDSTFNSTGYRIGKFSYYAPGRISVQQIEGFQKFADTIFVNTAGNIDSIRIYRNDNVVPGQLGHFATEMHTNYSQQQNVFKTLTSHHSNFYRLERMFPGGFSPHELEYLFDYFNQNLPSRTDTRYIWFSPGFAVNKVYTFNALSKPETVAISYVTPNWLLNSYRFVYE